MRKSLSLLVVTLLLGSAACEVSTGDEDDGTGTGVGDPRGGDRGRPVAPDGGSAQGGAGAQGDAGAPRDAAAPVAPTDAASASGNDASAESDAAAPGTPTTPTPTAPTSTETFLPLAECSGPPTRIGDCAAPDVFEPNDSRSASLLLDPRDGCAAVPGKLSTGKDVDFYHFVPTLTEPVRFDLGFEAAPTASNNVHLEVYDATNARVAYTSGSRLDGAWKWALAFVAKKGVAYYARVFDMNASSSCLGYELLVEPNFCTDAYEDNDTQSASTPGVITYGNTVQASVFLQDDDFFDLSAIQAAGARCTITLPDLTLSSVERVDVEFRTGSGSRVKYDFLNGARGFNTLNFTLDAGSGVASLRLFSDKNRCTKYSVLCNPL